MKNFKMFLSVAVIALAVVVNADYFLYWSISSAGSQALNGETDYAILYANNTAVGDSNSNRHFYSSGLNAIQDITDVSSYDEDTMFTVGVYRFDSVDDFTTAEDYYTQSGKLIFMGTAMSLAQLIRDGHAGKDSATIPTAWDAVPEPTGGMLVLVGLALLGLRRKR